MKGRSAAAMPKEREGKWGGGVRRRHDEKEIGGSS
jgi:hypothetical protein